MPTASSSTTADQAFFREELQRFGPRTVLASGSANNRPLEGAKVAEKVDLQVEFCGPELSLDECFDYCKQWATRHYENFSVVTWLLPRALRPHFYSIYAYCRWSDNLSDEVSSATESLALLRGWRDEAQKCFPTLHSENGESDAEPRHPVLRALAATVSEHQLAPHPFFDLLDAFTQDQLVTRYATHQALLEYCQKSANPVGRILLQLAGADSQENCRLSDEICTALQIANFCQDMARDAQIDRIYAPNDLMHQFSVSEADLLRQQCTPSMQRMLEQWVNETRQLFIAGRPLIGRVPKWLSIDVELFIGGGEAILGAIERQGFDVWTQRPTVSKATKAKLLLTAISRRMLPFRAAIPAGHQP